jgi:hypothetical protein
LLYVSRYVNKMTYTKLEYYNINNKIQNGALFKNILDHVVREFDPLIHLQFKPIVLIILLRIHKPGIPKSHFIKQIFK